MDTLTLPRSVWEFTKSLAIRVMLARVAYVPTCQRPNVPNACQLLMFMCQRAYKRANVPKVCQLFNLACQRAKSLLIFQLGVPTSETACQFFISVFRFFQIFLLRNAKGNFYTLLIYKIFYIILDIIVIHMIYIYVYIYIYCK